MGRMLRANTRAMDAACRIGERHFAVLLSGVGLATAHSRMEQLRRQCTSQIVVLNGQDLGLSLSLGVSSFPHTASKQEELLVASEAAVREAQRRGGNQVVLASIPFGDPV
jgi:diguanylate cyclase (GGDEF)-like protein